jgi:hypothetical protein
MLVRVRFKGFGAIGFMKLFGSGWGSLLNFEPEEGP